MTAEFTIISKYIDDNSILLLFTRLLCKHMDTYEYNH